MGKGTVDLKWAEEHHSLWLQEEQARVGRGELRQSATAAE
jgi:formate dehydrogenase subunit gamma